MSLQDLTPTYVDSADLLRARLRKLRCMRKTAKTYDELWWIKRRISELTIMLTQMNELAELTAHYYERGYHRNEKYTL